MCDLGIFQPFWLHFWPVSKWLKDSRLSDSYNSGLLWVHKRTEKHQLLLLCVWHSGSLKCFNMAYCWQTLVNGARVHAVSPRSFEETSTEEGQHGTTASPLCPLCVAPDHLAPLQSASHTHTWYFDSCKCEQREWTRVHKPYLTSNARKCLFKAHKWKPWYNLLPQEVKSTRTKSFILHRIIY